MNYLKTYHQLFESDNNSNSNSNLYTKVFDQEGYGKEIYNNNNNGEPKDPTYYNRIRYANNRDFSWYESELNLKFIVLYEGDKIIGVCKIGNWDKENPNKMSISYCSIDREYRNKGYLKLIIIELMKFCKNNNFVITASSWTVPGNLKLRPSLIKYSKIYGVEYIDHDNKHDAKHFYNKNLISAYEMTDDELDDHNNRGDVYENLCMSINESDETNWGFVTDYENTISKIRNDADTEIKSVDMKYKPIFINYIKSCLHKFGKMEFPNGSNKLHNSKDIRQVYNIDMYDGVILLLLSRYGNDYSRYRSYQSKIKDGSQYIHIWISMIYM